MEDIRHFIKKNTKEQYKLSIKYEDNETIYNYKFSSYTLKFIENTIDENISLKINNKTYDNITNIHLFLFDLFDYKNFEYIDLFLKQHIEKTPIFIEDFYDDYYDDFNNEFIANRHLILNKKIYKIKFVLKNNDFHLYYNLEIISGFDDILEKIKDIIRSIMNSNQSS
jgi:hypothetical protein